MKRHSYVGIDNAVAHAYRVVSDLAAKAMRECAAKTPIGARSYNTASIISPDELAKLLNETQAPK